MEINLTSDPKAFIRQAIETDRLHREEEAVQEALSIWEERQRTRAEILTAVDVAEASVARGEGPQCLDCCWDVDCDARKSWV